MILNTCLSCGSSDLLRHARRNGLYWLCMSCRQEVIPLDLSQKLEVRKQPSRSLLVQLAGSRK